MFSFCKYNTTFLASFLPLKLFIEGGGIYGFYAGVLPVASFEVLSPFIFLLVAEYFQPPYQ